MQAMDVGHIDITSTQFWLVVIVAALLLAPIKQRQVRRVLLAALNIGFLWLLLNVWVVAVIVAVLLVGAALEAIARNRAALVTLFGAILTATTFFVLHKVPAIPESLGNLSINPLLGAVGFSYVFLRLLELFRSVWESRVAPDVVTLVNYLLPFHMLPAGPIQAYTDFVSADDIPLPLTNRDVFEAVERIAKGFFKKFVLAYVLHRLFLSEFQSTGWLWLIELQVFSFWLYLDFSAYNDIVVGIGRLIGVVTPENFNRPFLARNVIDFWERWHISLSQWVRRNLFIPIQLNLVRQQRFSPLMCANVAVGVSFVFCGIWHGIGTNFLLWGLFHSAGLMCVNSYRHYLTKWIGAKRVKSYMADSRIRALSTFVTYQFIAVSLLTLFI